MNPIQTLGDLQRGNDELWGKHRDVSPFNAGLWFQ